jgi:mRNA interferase HigB
MSMRITSTDRLLEAARRHADAAKPLQAWQEITEAADWHHLIDVRQTSPHADAAVVESGLTVTIFNIGGNKYRLLTAISYTIGVVNVLAVLTHADYDKEKWKKTL